MITTATDFEALADRLRERTVLLARSAATKRLLRRHRDGALWRKAALLWPLFTKG